MYTGAVSPTLPQWGRDKLVIPYPDRIVKRNVSHIEFAVISNRPKEKVKMKRIFLRYGFG
jgi:hypothetical protein